MQIINKIIKFIKKYWLIVLLSLLIGSIAALLFIRKQLPPKSQPLPKPGIVLNLVDITPKLPVFESAWSTELIKFTFDQPLDPGTIKYNVTPQENTRLVFKEEAPNAFSVLPLTGWEENQLYTITIFKDLSSREGSKMTREIEITFTRKFPQNFVEPEESHEYPENR